MLECFVLFLADYVLVYEESEQTKLQEGRKNRRVEEWRDFFLQNLAKAGLVSETVSILFIHASNVASKCYHVANTWTAKACSDRKAVGGHFEIKGKKRRTAIAGTYIIDNCRKRLWSPANRNSYTLLSFLRLGEFSLTMLKRYASELRCNCTSTRRWATPTCERTNPPITRRWSPLLLREPRSSEKSNLFANRLCGGYRQSHPPFWRAAVSIKIRVSGARSGSRLPERHDAQSSFLKFGEMRISQEMRIFWKSSISIEAKEMFCLAHHIRSVAPDFVESYQRPSFARIHWGDQIN